MLKIFKCVIISKYFIIFVPIKIYCMIPKYFTLEEFISSATAKTRGIDNTPTFQVVDNLKQLCLLILDPVRTLYGKPIYVTSGYRCKLLNTAVGGVRNSQHLTGCAVDLQVNDLQTLFNLLAQNPNVDQLLFEHKGLTKWIHVSFAVNGKPRHNIINNYKAK